jgi:hypothetical protein
MEKYITGHKIKDGLRIRKFYHVVSNAEAELNVKGMEEVLAKSVSTYNHDIHLHRLIAAQTIASLLPT